LGFIKNHDGIPQDCKEKLLKVLRSVPELFSGSELPSKVFPNYQHSVELINNEITEFKSKPFPISGIRLQQLEDSLEKLIQAGILVRGDSEFTSPAFFVTKKPSDGSDAITGRLCYDYRKLNSIIKIKCFQLGQLTIFSIK
jgi:hypothetical protein